MRELLELSDIEAVVPADLSGGVAKARGPLGQAPQKEKGIAHVKRLLRRIISRPLESHRMVAMPMSGLLVACALIAFMEQVETNSGAESRTGPIWATSHVQWPWFPFCCRFLPQLLLHKGRRGRRLSGGEEGR